MLWKKISRYRLSKTCVLQVHKHHYSKPLSCISNSIKGDQYVLMFFHENFFKIGLQSELQHFTTYLLIVLLTR